MTTSVKNITWTAIRGFPGEYAGFVVTAGMTTKVAVIRDDSTRAKPMQYQHTRCITLELSVPVMMGQDKVQKFATLDDAKQQAAIELARFIAHCVK